MKQNITTREFGRLPDGRAADLFSLDNGNGIRISITNYGGIITSVTMPDRNGDIGEITLAYDTLEPYLARHPYFGAMIGRVANRISNGGFTIDGTRYDLSTNTGALQLHGGFSGFDRKLFTAESFRSGDVLGVRLETTSSDGEEGYPGNLKVIIVVSLDGSGVLRFDYEAQTDRPTPVNLTNHTYWNLAGTGKVLNHELVLHADRSVVTDERSVPTGELRPVSNSFMDFRQKKPIGRDFPEAAKMPCRGYDFCYCISGWDARNRLQLLPVAEVYSPESGRSMTVRSNCPGVQLYTGNNLPGVRDRNGAILEGQEAFCLETQHYPDSVNQPEFPSTILRPDDVYSQHTEYELTVDSVR